MIARNKDRIISVSEVTIDDTVVWFWADDGVHVYELVMAD